MHKLNRSLQGYIEDVPLFRLLGLAFAFILLCSVVVTGFIVVHFGNRIINSLVTQTADHAAEQIQSETENYLGAAEDLVNGTMHAMQANRVSIDSPNSLSRYLRDRAQDQYGDLISSIYYASVQGHVMSISVPELSDARSSPRVKYLDPEQSEMGKEYALNADGSIGQVLSTVGKFDPRKRGWFKRAVKADGLPVWSDIYKDFDSEHRVITRARAVIDDTGKLLGVAAVDLFLDQLQSFLIARNISEHSEVFIADGNGILLASTSSSDDDRMHLLPISDSDNVITRAAHEAVSNRSEAVAAALGSESQAIKLEGINGFLSTHALGQEYDTGWNLIIFIPSTDFLSTISKEIVILSLLVLLVLVTVIATMVGFLKLVIHPLSKLQSDARQIAAGHFDVQIQSSAKNEVGELASSFGHMQQRLKTTIEDLSQSHMLLQREYNLIESTLESLNDGVITFGIDGTIQFMNRSAEQKTGWSLEYVRGAAPCNIIASDRYEPSLLRTQKAIQQAIHGYDRQSSQARTSLFPAESSRPISCRLTPLCDSLHGPQGALLVFNELSELLQLQREHEQTLSRHRQLSHVVEEAANEIYVVEPVTFRITTMNRTARNNLGYNQAEAKVLTLHETIRDFRKVFSDKLLEEFASGQLTNTILETEHRRKSGKCYPTETRLHFMSDESPPYFALIAQDTTERRMQMQDLLLRDRAIAALDVGVFIIDQEQKALHFVNRAMTQITGYEAGELIGQAPSIFTGDENEIGANHFPWASVGTEPLLQVNLQCRRKDLVSYSAELSLSHMRNAAGITTHCIGIFEDVTRRQAAEARFRHSQKFDAIGRLSGGIAHDFNNLLNIIFGRLELLSTLALDEANRTHVQEAARAADMGARLTRRLLAFARQSPLAPTTINLNELLIETLSMLKAALTRRIRIQTDLEMNLWLLHTDRSEIENAVINLLINARDAMPGGGSILIQTSNISISAEDNTDLSLEAGEYVCLKIVDSGQGMDADTLSKVFEPFFTSKEQGKGTGLGLASIFGFIRQSGGDVVADSTVDQGTGISLYLPRYGGNLESVGDTREESPNQSGTDSMPIKSLTLEKGKIRVLVVEDNEQVLELTQARMKALDLTVHSVKSGKEAMRLIDKDSAYDLLFCDIVLESGTTGYDVAECMQANNPECKILLTSGFSESMLATEPGQSRRWQTLQKPYRTSVMIKAIADVLNADVLTDA